MINLFQIASNDQSVLYLGQVFGLVGSLLAVQNPNMLMGIMFKVLNTTALTIGAMLVVYVVVVGLLKTAQEGEFLGKQWNSLWVPVRTVLGIAALFPTATGYSAIQVLIMWVVLQGVGAGDVMWNTVLKYVNTVGSPYVGVDTGSLNISNTSSQMKILFQSLVCQASAKASYPAITVTSTPGETITNPLQIKYYCADQPSAPFCREMTLDPISSSAQVSNNTYYMGPNIPTDTNQTCGKLQYCDAGTVAKKPDPSCATDPNSQACVASKIQPSCVDPKSTACLACKAQQQALQAIVPALGSVAENIVNMDYIYTSFYESGNPKNLPSWVQDFCNANNIPEENCCIGGSTCAKEITNLKDYTTGTKPDYSGSAPDTIKTLYLNYPLKAYMQGSDFINAAVGQYTASVAGAVSESVQQAMETKAVTGWEANAMKYGWMLAGIYYFKMAEMNGANQKAAQLDFTVTPPSPDFGAGSTNKLKDYRNNYNAAKALVDAMTGKNQVTSPTFSSLPSGATDVQDAIGNAAAGLFNSFSKSMTGGNSDTAPTKSNPLVAVASFGYALMITAQVLFAICVTAISVATGFLTINPMVIGTGLTMNPAGEVAKALANFFGPFIVILISTLFTLGATLGIYVPLIPYMIFTMGAIGWLFAVIEAMVAGPIIALGILSPGGQHDILGRAEPAMMMLFNLFLRPSLMVFGMMAAMIVSIPAVNLVNSGFAAVLTSIISNPGLFETIMYIAVYVSFIITVLNKCFSLIYIIPEKILTWIGGPAVQYGEQEALGAAKQALEGAAGGTAGAAKESASHAGQVGAMAKARSMGKDQKSLKAEVKKSTE